MGDRVVIVVEDKRHNEYSPQIYAHWMGYRAIDILRENVHTFRPGDIGYFAARIVGAFTKQDPDSYLGVGIFDAPDFKPDDPEVDAKLFKLSHGDAGLLVIDCNTGEMRAYDGYLESEIEAWKRRFNEDRYYLFAQEDVPT